MPDVPLHTDPPADPARRRAVVSRFDFHAAVQVYRAFPVLVIAEGLDGQRQQGRPLFGEHGRDLPFGGAMDARVGPVRFPMVQVGLRLLQAFEAHALQRGLLRMAHAALHLPFAIRVPHPAGHRDHAVVPQHVGVHGVDRGIVDVGLEHALAQVVEHHHARAAAQPAEGLLMQLGPGLRAGVEDQEANRLAAVAEGQHEQAHAAILAAVRIADHGAGAVIDLGLFAGRGLDHGAGFLGGAAGQLAHEALDALVAAREAAGVDQVLPDRHGVAATGEPQFDGVAMHGARAGRRRRRRRLLGGSHAKVGGHPDGRFCVDRVGADLVGESVAAVAVAPSASGWASPEPAGVANSAPKSVVTPMAGFAPGESASGIAGAGGGSATAPWVGGSPILVPIGLAAEPQHRLLLDRPPPFPAGRPWSSECAAATIPAAPAL